MLKLVICLVLTQRHFVVMTLCIIVPKILCFYYYYYYYYFLCIEFITICVFSITENYCQYNYNKFLIPYCVVLFLKFPREIK